MGIISCQYINTHFHQLSVKDGVNVSIDYRSPPIGPYLSTRDLDLGLITFAENWGEVIAKVDHVLGASLIYNSVLVIEQEQLKM